MAIPTLLIPAIFYILFKIYRWWVAGNKYDKPTRMDGKIVIITGANTGIGKETALDLARRGATVYLACRNIEKAKEATISIVAATGNKNVIPLKLELSSFKSIRKFCSDFKESKIDVLINNAGVITEPNSYTEDGFEEIIGVNHLGHFLLTLLLLSKLKKAGHARIVNVSSIAHERGKIDKDNLFHNDNRSAVTTYSNSKLANVLFTKELARRLKGTNVTVNALHPGVIVTQMPIKFVETYGKIAASVYTFIAPFLIKTPEQGAQTTITCAIDPALKNVSGEYFVECKVSKSSKAAKDEALAKWLWDKSIELTDLKDVEI